MNRYRPTVRLALLSAALSFLISCAGAYAPDFHGRAAIKDVPFFPQNEYKCGPAAIASVFSFWGTLTTIEQASVAVYQEKLKGSLPIDLFLYAKEAGFEADYYKGSMADLKRNIDAGVPLIVFLNLGFKIYPVGHYVVVTGYDDAKRVVIAHSDMSMNAEFGYDALADAWEKNGFATLRIRPKGEPNRL
ncbi:MAG: C39 family peptidase [Deltaproteobacteria bacterium]|nr:C39 family peptidase [Deltaproteobacteria bacterium]